MLNNHIGSYQIPKFEAKLVHKSGVAKIFGLPMKGNGFHKVIGIRLSENKMRKVVGIGLGKTGTTSLAHCLTYLGYRHQWYNPDLSLNYRNNPDKILKVLENKDSCEDFPWPFLYREINRIYPDSKFILTVRKDPETWYKSLCKHFDRGGLSQQKDFDYGDPDQQKQLAYGYKNPHGLKQEHLDFYCNHIREIQDFFVDKTDKLLIVCWEQGDGWAEVCNFLGHPEPEILFPHANKAPSWQKI